jgi:hypothetical protein
MANFFGFRWCHSALTPICDSCQEVGDGHAGVGIGRSAVVGAFVKGRLVAVAGAVAVLLGTTVPAPAATVPPNAQVITNMPEAWGTVQAYRYISETADEIDAMQPGSTFRYAGYLFDAPEVTDALIRAWKRGVNVRVALDAHVGSTDWADLDASLGHDRSKGSFVYRVHGSGLSHDPRANLHVKLIQMSSTGTRSAVTKVGSQNLALTNTLGSSNETSTFDNRTIYKAGRAYFNQIVADTGRGYSYHTTTVGQVKIHWYPEGPDTVAAALGDIGSTSGCSIRVAMFQWSDSSAPLHKARQLTSLARRGCRVQVVWNYTPHRVLIGVKTGRELLSSHMIGIRNVRVGGTIYAHDKTTIIETSRGTRVFSGSGNFIDSRGVNADAVVENTNAGIYPAYTSHFDLLYSTGVPGVQPVYGPGALSVGDREYDDDGPA